MEWEILRASKGGGDGEWMLLIPWERRSLVGMHWKVCIMKEAPRGLLWRRLKERGLKSVCFRKVKSSKILLLRARGIHGKLVSL